MAKKVSFRTKSGKKISFTARAKGRRTHPLSAYNCFVSKRAKKYLRAGKSPTQAFRLAAKDWKKR